MVDRSFCFVWNAKLPEAYSKETVIHASRGERPECRAYRLVKGSLKFLYLKVPHKYPNDKLRKALKSIVKDGVKIEFISYDNRRRLEFAFLGFTESTIRSGHIILLQKTISNPTEYVPSPKELLEQFGDLRDVFRQDGPGKYVARLGLSFSATIQSVNPTFRDLVQIPDRRARDGVLTTDGCGILRAPYARNICSNHNFDARTSVFQIRRGGIKGVLVAYPDDWFNIICKEYGIKNPDDYQIAYRKSMLKYKGGPTHVEITGISTPPKSARLSLSVITILWSLNMEYGGIGQFHRSLKGLLKLQLRSIEMIPYDRQEALNYIDGELDAEGGSFYQDVYEMLLAGHPMSDAYIRKQLRSLQRIQYDSLREKLNIKIPRSCYVYGVVDELGVLGEDEVYIQLPHREGVVIGKVLIARHPARKPSDVRVMKAVNKPELIFLTNCIVFPRAGQHSIPGSMSGGDLDGDKYFVSWDPSIIPRRTVWPRPSTSQADESKVDWSRRNLNDALVDLFVEQRGNKLVGIACNEWQFMVEKYKFMARAKYLQDLATVIEQALDILKSGKSYAALCDRYKAICLHYLKERMSLQCRKNGLSSVRNLIPSLEEDENICYSPDPDLDLRDQNEDEWKIYYREGTSLVTEFNKRLAIAIMKDEENRKNFGDDYSWYRRAEEGPTLTETLKKGYINKYFPRGQNILSEVNTSSYIRASAWYFVGYERARPAFAWLGARFLHSIKSYATNDGSPGISIGALKKAQAKESSHGLERPRYLTRRVEDHGVSGGRSIYLIMTAERIDSDSDEDDDKDNDHTDYDQLYVPDFLGYYNLLE